MFNKQNFDKPIKKVRKAKKLQNLIPNPRYAAEEFTYVPDPQLSDENEVEPSLNKVPNQTISTSPVFIENFENLRNINFKLTQDNEVPDVAGDFSVSSNLVTLVKCDKLHQDGYCAEQNQSKYTEKMVESLLDNCQDIIAAFQAFVPEDIDSLGDNSESVISSEKDEDRPWSWTVSAYNKRQVCHSSLSFIKPSYALNTKGMTLY